MNPDGLRIDERWIARLGIPRPMTFRGPDPARDLPAHVRAGSAVRRFGGRLLVVQDDVNALALVDEGAVIRPLVLPASVEGHRSFGDDRGNKAQKMDLEACVVLPDDRLVAFGSGSTAARERLVVVDSAHRVRVVDGSALYGHLRARHDFAGSELNVEGAVVVSGRLKLFQRGNGAVVDGRAPVNAIGDLELESFVRWLDGGGPLPELLDVRQVDLGQVNGVPYGFTDATVLPDGRVVFLAGAEDSPDTYRDGVVLGTRIGLLDGERVVMCDVVDADGAPTRLKLEGIDYVGVAEGGGLELVAVADMDDPDIPAVVVDMVWREE